MTYDRIVPVVCYVMSYVAYCAVIRNTGSGLSVLLCTLHFMPYTLYLITMQCNNVMIFIKFKRFQFYFYFFFVGCGLCCGIALLSGVRNGYWIPKIFPLSIIHSSIEKILKHLNLLVRELKTQLNRHRIQLWILRCWITCITGNCNPCNIACVFELKKFLNGFFSVCRISSVNLSNSFGTQPYNKIYGRNSNAAEST